MKRAAERPSGQNRTVSEIPGEVRDVILRDGSTLRLHPPRVGEAEELVGFFARLSTESLYSRFHGLPSVGPWLVEPFLDPDGVDDGGLVGTLTENGDERIVALATWSRLRDPTTAEVAFAVADELQGKGVGTRLLEQLAASASAVGIERFVAEVLPENRAMLRVFSDAGFEVTRHIAGGAVEVSFPIEPTEAFRAQVDLRDHAAVVASLEPFFEPESVAVVGASPREGSLGGQLFRNVVRAGFAGRAYPVNRSGSPVTGVPGFPSIGDVGPVDLAVIVVTADDVLDAAREALEAGARAICVISAGFAETGKAGAQRQEQLLTLVRAHGARLLGPNCLGIASSGVRLNATFARSAFPSGSIGFASQSGALGLALLETARARSLGFSAFVSIGNKADVSSNDLLEYWEDDEATRLVLLYVESFGNPRKFVRIARRVARQKPVLAMKAGRSKAGARAASSHTAALAGSEAAVEALFRQAGVIRADSLDELLDVASLYAGGATPQGRRVGVVTNAGGLGILCADACEGEGLELPPLADATVASLGAILPPEASVANPVDMLGSATATSYEQVLPALLADPGLDAVIVLFVPAASVAAEDVAGAICRAVDADTGTKPVVAAVLSSEGVPLPLRRGGRIAAFAYPESAARALGRAAERADWLRRPVGSVPGLANVEREVAEAVVTGALERADSVWLPAGELRTLLRAYGITVVAERVAATTEDAVAAARELGFPCAVKTAEPGVHKLDVGGVALALRDEADVRAAVERIGPPVLVQPMVGGGAELLAGLVQDPVFGPLVAFGPGGSLAELIGEAGFALAPLTDRDARELVLGGKAGRLVRGFRGAPPRDIGALADLLHRLARLGEDLPEVAELDLNPVMALPDGYVAVDARLRVARSAAVAPPKTW